MPSSIWRAWRWSANLWRIRARTTVTNVVAGLSLLEAMLGAGVKSIVFSSTCAVYGVPEKTPLDEGMPTRPINPYGESKLAFERALAWFAKAHEFRVTSLRYFNAAGASERSGERHDPETHLIPLVLGAAAGTREHVTIFGDDYPTRDGTCVRDYIHVLDLADAHLLALQRQDPRMGIYNLGCGGDGHTIREVLDCAARVTGRRIPTVIGPRRPGDRRCSSRRQTRRAASLDGNPGASVSR